MHQGDGFLGGTVELDEVCHDYVYSSYYSQGLGRPLQP
jgi:hypothetical protein